jgi:hypothetical protein
MRRSWLFSTLPSSEGIKVKGARRLPINYGALASEHWTIWCGSKIYFANMHSVWLLYNKVEQSAKVMTKKFKEFQSVYAYNECGLAVNDRRPFIHGHWEAHRTFCALGCNFSLDSNGEMPLLAALSVCFYDTRPGGLHNKSTISINSIITASV